MRGFVRRCRLGKLVELPPDLLVLPHEDCHVSLFLLLGSLHELAVTLPTLGLPVLLD